MRLFRKSAAILLAAFITIAAGADLYAAPRDGREPGRFQSIVLRLKKLLGITSNDYITPPLPAPAPTPNP